jgi:hypothetical protein
MTFMEHRECRVTATPDDYSLPEDADVTAAGRTTTGSMGNVPPGHGKRTGVCSAGHL